MESESARILVVGDTATLEMMQGLQALEGHEIDGCRGEAEALRRLRRKQCDVLITSRFTSIEEDLAFLEEARRAHPGVRAILIASEAERQEVIEAMRSHVFALFTVPFDPTELASMILRAIKERGWKDGIEIVSGLPNWVSLRVTSRIVSAERLLRFMEEMGSNLKEEDRKGLLAAFRELLINAMEHGAGFGRDQVVDVSAVRTERAIVFHFRDPGPGFNLDGLEHAAISNPDGDPIKHMERREALGMRPGGFGILIARRVADEMYYNEVGNEVLLIKHLTEGG